MGDVVVNSDIRLLMKFIKNTQEIATRALQSLDSNASFYIIPSHDLGIPYDVDRLGGGFPNGVYINWNCDIPVIPVDTTVNVCTASIFELDCKNNNEIFLQNLQNIEATWKTGCYTLNFNRGNHFILLCEDEGHKKYLVMHSSAKEFTKGYNGLYPVKGNWYFDKIKVYRDGERYFRYICGHEAELFCKIASSLNGYNEIRHEQIAESLIKEYAIIKKVEHHHHYGMPNNHSINIGCYLKSEGEIFPIFSKPNYPITLYRLDSSSQKVEDGKYIVPHGWGKGIKGSCRIDIDYDKRFLRFNDEEFRLFESDTFYRSTILQYRDYITSLGVNTFYDCFSDNLKGTIYKTLYQLIAYTVDGINVLNKER